MTGIIIENEGIPDNSIQAFLQDFSDLFESIDEQTYCLHRKPEDLLDRVLKADAIIVASTWMYKDQLHDYLDAFLTEGFPPKKIFVYTLTRTLNEWKYSRGYMDEAELEQKVKQLIDKGFEFYDFAQDAYSEYIEDTTIGSWTNTRSKYIWHPLQYSEEEGIYFTDNPVYDLKSNKEDLTRYNNEYISRNDI